MGLTLRFADAATEADFRHHDDADSRRRRMTMCWIGAFVWAAFGFLDPLLIDDASRFVPVRIALSTLILLAGAVLWRAAYPRAHEALACAAPLSVAWASDTGPFLVDVPPHYYAAGTLLAAMSLFTLAGARFRAAVVTGLLMVLGLAVAAVCNEPAADAVLVATGGGAVIFGLAGSWMLEDLRRREYRLLHSILPGPIVAKLRQERGSIAEASDDVSVLFADVVDFTPMAGEMSPTQLVALLDRLFREFDAVCRRHGVEKIKTIGDAYMAAAGVPRPDPDHAGSITAVALDLLDVAARFEGWPAPLRLRVGISSGPVVAGVIGDDKFAYDLWGDTVNTASRMESHGEAGLVVVSAVTRALLGDRYAFGPPRETLVKGKGAMTTYVLATSDS